MKRANGTGSVVKLPGNRRRPYAVKVSGRNRYGHVVQKILSYHEKAAEAQAALESFRQAQAAGAAPAVDKLDVTVGEVFELWKAREYGRETDWRDSVVGKELGDEALEKVAGILNGLEPDEGEKKVSVQQKCDAIAESGLSGKDMLGRWRPS